MRISSAFPSEYLKASDLQGRQVRVPMSHVEMKDIGGDHKPILFFVGHEKGMVLNKTNANNIAVAYGDDTDDWTDKEIILFEAMVDFQGKTVPAIRVRAPNARDKVNGKKPAARPTNGAHEGSSEDRQRYDAEIAATPQRDPATLDDEIPF
jgi:hypothetical protein